MRKQFDTPKAESAAHYGAMLDLLATIALLAVREDWAALRELTTTANGYLTQSLDRAATSD